MQTKKKKCFKKGLGAASVRVSQVFAPCCTHCALLWFLKLRAMSFSNTYVKQLAGNSCGTSPPEVLSAAVAAAPTPGPGAVPRPASRLTWSLNPAEIGTSSPGAPGNGVRGSDCAQSPPRASRGTSLTDGRGQRVGLGASARPFLEHFSFPLPPHCAKCWKRQLQYYCSEAHLVPALDGLALISIAVETGASRVTSLGISYRVGFLYQLCYLLYTL